MIFTRARSAALLIALTTMLIASALSGAVLAAEAEQEVDSAVEWLLGQQLDDGGFPGFDGESDPGATADSVLALAAAGIDVENSGNGDISPIDYLTSVAEDYSATQGGAAKLAIAMLAAGHDAEDVDGVDVVEQLQERADPATGAYDEQVFIHALAMIAVLTAGHEPVDGAVDFLIDRQIEDGSWSFTGDTEPGTGDTNTTALAIQALVAANAGEDAVAAGLDYLLEAQIDDGSVVYAIGMEAPPMGDSNSTALAIQAMIAAGHDADSGKLQAATDALLGFQNESGALHYRADMPDDNALSTAQAIPAMLHLAFPIQPAADGSGDYADLLQSATVPADSIDSDSCDFFEVTGHNVCDEFNQYWWQGGGLAIFGYPVSEAFDTVADDGTAVVVQYFERARFELVVDPSDGEELTVAPLGADRAFGFDTSDAVEMEGECEEIEGSSHTVCGVFLEYWTAFGGLETFGLPVTAAHDDDGMTVQYFEYARFEHQPGEWPDRFDVLLGRLGAEHVNEVIAE